MKLEERERTRKHFVYQTLHNPSNHFWSGVSKMSDKLGELTEAGKIDQTVITNARFLL